MAASLDDMPDYEHFQAELDTLLEKFLMGKNRINSNHFHFFIEFLTFHCHFTTLKDIKPDTIKVFIEWFEEKSNQTYKKDRLESDLLEFISYSYNQTK